MMMGYQVRSNLLNDENGDLLADSHNIINERVIIDGVLNW
jgi:hypothetical protein